MADRPEVVSQPYETGVDLGGLMAVLSKHLYSPDVAVRELVQNAHDSITRRRIISDEPFVGSIHVETDGAKRQLTVTDNGSGLTEPEIHTLLATVGVGATGQLRDSGVSDDLIGLFGLGFLSSFVVADEVMVETTSITTPDATWQYRSADGFTYSLTEVDHGSPRVVGTKVTVSLSEEFEDLANPTMIDNLLSRYCSLLTEPVTLNDQAPINLPPPWRRKDPTTDHLMLFAESFDRRFSPIAAVPVSTESGWLGGQLWIHSGSTYGNADNRHLSVYVRGMLLADNDVELLPRWAGFVSGVVESADLVPTASRETLQQNAAYAEAQIAISEALITGRPGEAQA